MSFPGSTGTEVSLFKPQTECSNYLGNSGQTFENPCLYLLDCTSNPELNPSLVQHTGDYSTANFVE